MTLYSPSASVGYSAYGEDTEPEKRSASFTAYEEESSYAEDGDQELGQKKGTGAYGDATSGYDDAADPYSESSSPKGSSYTRAPSTYSNDAEEEADLQKAKKNNAYSAYGDDESANEDDADAVYGNATQVYGGGYIKSSDVDDGAANAGYVDNDTSEDGYTATADSYSDNNAGSDSESGYVVNADRPAGAAPAAAAAAPAVPAGPAQRDWNEEFQHSVATYKQSIDARSKFLAAKQLSELAQEFVTTATRVGRVIIDERELPVHLKSVKPAAGVGGIAGGEKVRAVLQLGSRG